MDKRKHRLISIVALVLLFIAAIFAPTIFFDIVDSGREKQMVITTKEDSAMSPDSNENELGRLEQMMHLVENLSYKNMLAIQKKQMTDSELKGLQLELNKLRNSGLIHGIGVTALSDHLVYVAYYNVASSDSEDPNSATLSVKEYKFSDYTNFEYSFWVDSKTGMIYEVMLIDDNADFTLSDIDYMNGVGKYYGIDQINPLEVTENNQTKEYQISINDYQATSYYLEFSIYHPSEGSFVANSSGINWSILPRSLKN